MSETRIAFIGDDDLASIGLLHLTPPRSLLLLDIDQRITDTIRSEVRRLKLDGNVIIERVDLSDEDSRVVVIDKYADMFDLVVTDPPYAQDGMAVFVSTAMALTAYTGEIHIAVPSLLAEAWSDELLHAVQAMMVQHGFLIDRVIPGAFTYETSDVISSLVVARRLPGGPAIRGSDVTRSGRFYTTRLQPQQLAPLGTPPENQL